MRKALLFCFFIVVSFIGASAQRPSTNEDCGNCGNSGANSAYYDSKKATTELYVFPNPASDFISLSNDDAAAQINVLNMLGRKVKAFNVEKDDKYYISELPAGTYLVQVVDKQGKTLVTQRVSKR